MLAQHAGSEPVKRLRHYYPALEAVQAELDKHKRGGHQLSITISGDPYLAVEAMLKPVERHPGVAAEWLITKVIHRLSKGNDYQCDVEAELPNVK